MRVLVTGGAGFIGSSIADALVAAGHDVAVLDDLSTGYADNVPAQAELFEGDVADADVVAKAVAGAEMVFHLAAHRAVLRSVEDPLATDTANTHGTLTVLKAASPYAVTKLAGEHYCRVFAELYGLETLSLRYFNVFGPRQRPDSAYAAVIPLFIESLRGRQAPVVHGDGGQSRAFTYIDDVVAANLAAAHAPPDACRGQAYNIAGETSYTLLDLLDLLGRLLGVTPKPEHVQPRAGDIRHSRADISAARASLGYEPRVGFEDGLSRALSWFESRTPAPE